MARLADEGLRARVDPTGFHHLLAALPQQSRDAWRLGLDAQNPSMRAPRRVLLVGLGGSAIGADVVATLASDLTPTPVQVVRNYRLPPLTADTLVILCSFSGNTEEVLEAFGTVTASGASGLAITTGGRLAELASAAGMPVVSYQWGGPPRTGLGYGIFVPLAILRRLGVLDISDAEVDAGIAAMQRGVESYGLDAPGNRAQQLATWLYGGVPAVVGPDILEVAARRWAGEISENAKQVAAAFAIPEFNHNQIEAAALQGGEEGLVRIVLLDAPPVHPRNRLRITATADAIRAAGRAVEVADAGGDTPLEAILASSALGSWTSYYLALLREVEPAGVPVMERLKVTLRGE